MGLLNKEIFKGKMVELEHAFNTTTKTETIKIYWRYLSERFTDEEFCFVVEEIILKERFFPAISVFISRKRQTLLQKAL